MNEPKITPLARRLAEENSIDWRQLTGTGPEGTVVERDILGFLAKVMAGEVTLPPAPEEVPQASPGAIPNMAQAQAALQREGVQLGDLMPGLASPPPAPNLTDDSLLDDLEFDIDLDLDEAPVTLEEAPAAAPVLETPPMPTPKLDWDAPPAPSLPDLEPPTPPAAPTAPSPALIWETQEVVASIPNLEPPTPQVPQTPELELPSLEPELPSPDLEPPALELEPPALAATEAPSLEPEPAPEPEPLAPVMEPEPPVAVAPVLEVEPASAPIPIPTPEPVMPAAVAGAVAGLGVAATSTPATALPRMQRVQAWQRSVEVQAAQEASNTLSEAWRINVGLYPLLFRAVDRALADTQTPLQATRGVLEGEELHSQRVSASQSLRGLLDSLQMASDPAEGLAVLSLADTALDQVIFPGASTVILGRIKDDYATLSLSADLETRQAAALLERIAYYLERPILLV